MQKSSIFKNMESQFRLDEYLLIKIFNNKTKSQITKNLLYKLISLLPSVLNWERTSVKTIPDVLHDHEPYELTHLLFKKQ